MAVSKLTINALTAAVAGTFLSLPATASTVTLVYNATIVSEISLGSTVGTTTSGYSGFVGQAFTMTFTGDTDADYLAPSDTGYYGTLSYSFGTVSDSTTGGVLYIRNWNDPSDQFLAVSLDSSLDTGLSGFSEFAVGASLFDTDGTVFSDASFPTSVDLAQFEVGLIELSANKFAPGECGIGASYCFENLFARIDSVVLTFDGDQPSVPPTLSAVPLPAGVLGLMTGLGALAGLRRRRRK